MRIYCINIYWRSSPRNSGLVLPVVRRNFNWLQSRENPSWKPSILCIWPRKLTVFWSLQYGKIELSIWLKEQIDKVKVVLDRTFPVLTKGSHMEPIPNAKYDSFSHQTFDIGVPGLILGRGLGADVLFCTRNRVFMAPRCHWHQPGNDFGFKIGCTA